jgi:hypothetical protein
MAIVVPLDAIRRPLDTPIWKLEAALKCRSCRTPRHSPRVHMIKLTMQREITPYFWSHPEMMMTGGSAGHPSSLFFVDGSRNPIVSQVDLSTVYPSGFETNREH